MNVLIACEFSGIVRDAFAARGHRAVSCDFLPTEQPGPHLQGDVLNLLESDWDLMIAHPPCTYMSNSGVCWLVRDGVMNVERAQKLHRAIDFFNTLASAPIPRIALENPIPHKYARQGIGRYTQIIQPWQFGHSETKSTCLWLKGLPPLVPTNNVKEQMLALPKNKRERLHYLPPSPDRWKERSRTYTGIAQAMAQQWS